MHGRVRPAQLGDIPRILELGFSQREAHARRHPIDRYDTTTYRARRHEELAAMIDDPDGIAFAVGSEVIPDGALLGRMLDASPEYEPGGRVCFIEEFLAVDDSIRKRIGDRLLEAATDQVLERGGVVIRIACSVGDLALADFLAARAFSIATEWYYARPRAIVSAARGFTPASDRAATLLIGREPAPDTDQGLGLAVDRPSAPAHDCGIRRATVEDVPAIIALLDRQRTRYDTFQPVFWRKASAPAMTFAPQVTDSVLSVDHLCLVHENEGEVDGALISSKGRIDDLVVAAPSLWLSVGAALLVRACRYDSDAEISRSVITSAHADGLRRTTISNLGYERVTDWFVLNLKRILP